MMWVLVSNHHENMPYNFDPLKPHFYIVKLGFAGVYIIFVISAKIDCGYSSEPPNEYPQSMFWAEIWKISEFLYLKIFSFWKKVNFSTYLNRRVFVMCFAKTLPISTIMCFCGEMVKSLQQIGGVIHIMHVLIIPFTPITPFTFCLE